MGTTNRHERGGVFLTVLCTILGVLIILVGLVFFAMAVSFTFDGEEFGLIMFVSIIGAIAFTAGILLIILPHRLPKDAKANAPMAGPETTEHGPRIISRETLAGPDGPSASSGPASERGPVPAPAPASKPSTSATEEIANLVTRSDDVLATLKDLVRHEASGSGTNRHLVSMLKAAGLMSWDNAPVFEAGRLTRTHHFWMRQNINDFDDETYDRFISVEAALNINQDLDGLASTATVEESYPLVSRHIFSAMTSQVIKRFAFQQALDAAYPGKGAEASTGEWIVRSCVASAAECAITPFRVVYDQRVNVAGPEHAMVLLLELPRPNCMSLFATDSLQKVALARSYALRLSVLLADHAIRHSQIEMEPFLETVYVNCHEHGSDETILSLRLDQQLIKRLSKLLADESVLEGNGFPTDDGIRAQFGPDGWFTPVEPFVAFEDELVSPRWRFTYPELVDKPVSESLRALTGAHTVSDLGINENAGRLAAWDRLIEEPWSSTEEIVSKLKEMLFEAKDITVTEACNRTIEALLEGTVDAQDREELNSIFIGGTALERAVRTAEAALDETDSPSDPEKAIAVLSEQLAPIEALGAYLDDSDTIYRYYGSLSERIRFNLDIDDHRRAVRLVPDAYYNALSNISIAYDELGNFEKAQQYSEEMIRIAPASIHAAMRKVRVLEHQSRIFEAADLIKSILRYASTPRDAAICHYRLAFMEWKLGREDLAVACYQRALAFDTEMSQQAREELDDLLKSDNDLKRLSDDEVFALLAREGIPLGCDDSDRRRMLGTAALCTDEGIFWGARPMVGILFNMSGDDVMMGVYRSLAPRE